MKPKSRTKVVTLLIVLLAITFAGIWWMTRTYHFAVVQDGILYRSGNRGLAEFSHAIQKSHIKTVVSLIDDKELHDPKKPQFQEEADYLAKNGVKLERIPVTLGGWPSGDDLKKFIAIAADPTNRPVLVHCAQGVRRTGMFVAAYEESAMSYSKEKANASIESFGHTGRTIEDIQAFIDSYDPATKSLATTMPATGNE